MLHLQRYKQTKNIRYCLSSSGVFSYNTTFLLTAQKPLKITEYRLSETLSMWDVSVFHQS